MGFSYAYDISPDGTAPILTPWRIPAIALSDEDVIDFLATCFGKEMLAPGILTGTDIRFFTKVLRFVGALMAKEQFIPGLSERDGIFKAVWEPVIAGKDTEILSTLARIMPHACRALTENKKVRPNANPVDVISWVAGFFVDYLVRLYWIDKPRSKVRKAVKKTVCHYA